MNDRNTWAHWGLGLAQLSADAHGEDTAELDRALRMGADWDAQPELYVLTQIFVATQPVDKLATLYERVIDARPNVAKYRVMLAIAYAKAGRPDKARAQALQAVALDPAYEAGAREFVQRLR